MVGELSRQPVCPHSTIAEREGVIGSQAGVRATSSFASGLFLYILNILTITGQMDSVL